MLYRLRNRGSRETARRECTYSDRGNLATEFGQPSKSST